MSCTPCYKHHYDQACEYVVPVKLVVPVFVEPKVYVQSTCAREKIQVTLEPELFLQPEVKASNPICTPPEDCYMPALAAESID